MLCLDFYINNVYSVFTTPHFFDVSYFYYLQLFKS